MKIKLAIIVGLVILVSVIGFYISLIKYPINTGAPKNLFTTDIYYRGIMNTLYFRQYRDCGFLGCFGPDLMPYTRDILLKDVDASNFKYLGSTCSWDEIIDCSSSSFLYGDGKHLIIYFQVIPDGDLATLIFKNKIAYDKNNVYNNDIYKVSNPSAYKELECSFYQDDKNVYSLFGKQIQTDYWYRETLPISNVKEFKMIPRNGKDCYSVNYVAEDDKSYFKLNSSGLKIIPK